MVYPRGMTAIIKTIQGLVGRGSAVDVERLREALSDSDERARVEAVRQLTKRDMAALWEGAEGAVVTAEDFVPAGAALGVEVIHEGKNSLPVASCFQKRFTPAAGRPGVVYGYNHNWFNFTTAGPGFFVGHHDAARGEFGLDYYQIPPADAPLPAPWPAIRRNDFGLSTFIYARMIDYMRKVAEGVTIGRAWRAAERTDNYFVLARTGG